MRKQASSITRELLEETNKPERSVTRCIQRHVAWTTLLVTFRDTSASAKLASKNRIAIDMHIEADVEIIRCSGGDTN
jgi:hypothetical protein